MWFDIARKTYHTPRLKIEFLANKLFGLIGLAFWLSSPDTMNNPRYYLSAYSLLHEANLWGFF